MARMRYNTLAFNSLNCLPSMIQVPGYEDCALTDVWKYTGDYDDSYLGNATNMFRKEQIESGQYAIIKKMSIQEKTSFWNDVFEAAKNRGIQISFSSMNIYTFSEEYYNCYGITDERDNPVTKDYLYKGYKTLLETFPQITTLDSGTGENMDYPADTAEQSENWLFDVYGKAVEDFIRDHPERAHTMTFGSSWELSDHYLDKLRNFPCKVQITARYNDTHLYSVPTSKNQASILARLPQNVQIFYRLKADDSYHLTWGDPSFARELCTNIKDSQNRVSGYYFGGDGYNYVGKEYEFVDEDLNGDYYTNRHWVNFTMMGRFGYNPEGMTNEDLEKLFIRHYQTVRRDNAQNAWKAMNTAGKVLPQILHLHQPGGTDSAFLAELCWSHPSLFGFLDIRRFINSDLADPQANTMSIKEYAIALQNGETRFTKETPFDVIDNLKEISKETMKYVEAARKDMDSITDKKFKSLVTDQEAFAILADYYANKFSAAMNLRIYNDSNDENYHTKAIDEIRQAAATWETYAKLWSSRFKVERLARHGVIDPMACIEKSNKDIDIVINWKTRKLS